MASGRDDELEPMEVWMKGFDLLLSIINEFYKIRVKYNK